MRVLAYSPCSRPIRERRTITATFDLELDRGIVARGLVVIVDDTGRRNVCSRRHDGQQLTTFTPEATATVLDLLDLAARDRAPRAA